MQGFKGVPGWVLRQVPPTTIIKIGCCITVLMCDGRVIYYRRQACLRNPPRVVGYG